MKFNFSFTMHFLAFISLAMVMAPAKLSAPSEKASACKVIKVELPTVSIEEGSDELLHSEILFRY